KGPRTEPWGTNYLPLGKTEDCFYFSISFSIAEHTDAGVSSVKSIPDKVTVKKENIQDVVGNDKYRINNRIDNQYEPRPIQDILRDAESLVGEELLYNVIFINCEHFVTLLRYGRPRSQQVQLFGMTSHTELNCTFKCLKGIVYPKMKILSLYF
uniref:LRAT domain-containing protein n=1 Tax=Sinocyclocheilus rhinocerous TaxID=307959 RepID=A0A673GZJ6_9TELE